MSCKWLVFKFIIKFDFEFITHKLFINLQIYNELPKILLIFKVIWVVNCTIIMKTILTRNSKLIFIQLKILISIFSTMFIKQLSNLKKICKIVHFKFYIITQIFMLTACSIFPSLLLTRSFLGIQKSIRKTNVLQISYKVKSSY